MKPRVLIIGLDGATFDVIGPMVEKGLLPNIARLMKEGIWGELRSTIHPITPQAWSTFLTGKNAGKHGIFDFTARKEGSYDIEFVNASSRMGESLFMYLGRLGVNVGAIAVPFTYPPEPVNGFMFSGLDAPAEDERAVHPRELYEEIRNKFGNYYIHLASPVGRKNDEEKFWKDIQTEDRNRTDITLHLMEKTKPELLMTVYNNTDRVQHQYLTYRFLESLSNGNSAADRESLVAKTYENTDRELGRVLERADDDTIIMLMSDHGSGPIRRVFFLNRWLEENGFLNYKETGPAGLKAIDKARFLAKRFLPRWAKNFIKTVLPGMRDRVESYRCFSEIDWENTKAYAFGMYGNVFINLNGREPHGTVREQDFDSVCREISEKLAKLEDPDTGERLVEKVYRGRDLYEGPKASSAPNLIIKWRDYSYYTSAGAGRENGSYFGNFLKIDSSEFDHVGTHRLNGIFVASGKGIKKGAKLSGASIADVTPTVIFALGKPIPDDLDGKVLKEIFEKGFLEGNAPRYSAGSAQDVRARPVNYSKKEASEVAERLKGLGYL